MNDIIWYSRFAVLVGALVLLVQAVAGRASGFVTLLAVVLLCGGFVVFVVALAVQGRRGGGPDTEPASSPAMTMDETPDTSPAPEENRREPTPPETRVETDAGA